jgi:hypothetical protein
MDLDRPILVAVPASTAVAKFLDEHDSSNDGSTAFITHLDHTEVVHKMYDLPSNNDLL